MIRSRSFIKTVFLLPLIVLLILFAQCSEKKEKQREKAAKQLSLSKNVDELIKDSIPVNPLIDSLRTEFYYADEKQQIRLLGELAENWRPYTYYLASEELTQSKKLGDKELEGDALCKFGIYYTRKFNFDSANYYLGQAAGFVGAKDNIDNIVAQGVSWQAEILRLQGETGKSIELQDNAIARAGKANDKKRLAFCNISKGESYRIQGDFPEAIESYKRAIAYADTIGDLNKKAVCYNSMGEVYRVQNNYPVALDFFNKGLDLAKRNKNNNQIAFCLSCMGDIYSSQKDSKKAIDFYEQALKIAQENNLKLQECNSLSSLGLANYLLDEKDIALDYMNRSITLAEEIGNKDKIAFASTILADIYNLKNEKQKALENYERSIKIAEETGNKAQLANSYNRIASFYLQNKELDKARKAAEASLALSKETETPEGVKNSAKILSEILEKQNSLSDALKMLHIFIQMKDSINNEENVKQLAAVEYKAKEEGLKAEQIAREAANKAERDRKDEELKRQKTIRYAFTIGFGLVLILVIVVFRNLQQNKKKNRIITAQKKEVEKQKELVEEKNKEITDSITYAKRLQEAILPPVKMVRSVFPESFVLYIPKDIIAGDFYWMEHLDEHTFFAAADSTGHGVPGAMVSVVCSNALNRAVKEFQLKEPGKVLDKTRELVLETFAKSEGDVKDGMDISLLCINRKNKTVSWAGANNPLWYIDADNKDELSEIKADKQPIGKTDDPKPFTTHPLPYKEGQLIYLITDGYADQFGGPKGKKFKYKQLEDLLLANKEKNLEQQMEILRNTFNSWKDSYEQVDDVTVIGLKI